jgi:hypothetical protein
MYFIINKGQIVFGHFPLNCLFDQVLCDIIYSQQISDKCGHCTGNVERQEKIDIENDFPYLTAISSGDEDHMTK